MAVPLERIGVTVELVERAQRGDHELTMTRTPTLRPILAIVLLALLTVTLVATALYVGSQRPVPHMLRNGAVVNVAEGDLFIADQLGGTPRLVASVPGDATVPAFSPNGDRVAFTGPGGSERTTVFTVRPDGSDLRELAGWNGWDGSSLRWSPDGTALAVTTDGILEGGAGGTGPRTWQLAVVAADGSGLRMVDAKPNTHAGRAEWRPDGRLIAFVGYTRTRDIFLAERDGTNVRTIPGAANIESDVAWSPDGKRLAFMRYSADRTVEIVVLELDADGSVTGSTAFRPEPQITALEAGLTPRWSPDGSQLVYAVVDDRSQHDRNVVSPVLRIGTAAPDGSDSRIVATSDAVRTSGVDWSPDGRSLVVVRGDGLSWLIDPATGEKASAEMPIVIGDWQGLAP